MMRVSLALDMMTRMVHGMRPLWREAGNCETAFLARRLRDVHIEKPIFITGMARAGSTLLLEYIAAHSGVASHQYRDFPFIFTPYFSRRFTACFAREIATKERAHGDKIFVSPRSPEAMEEMLWRAFAQRDGAAFAAFYRSHIQKLLLSAGASRYVAKNNNLLARLPTLLTLFPDARVIIPLRDPVMHIGSLMRQHQHFMREANHPRAIRHLQAQGHDEFGPTRAWHSADEIAGWAAQWNAHYRAVLPYLGQENFLLVPFAPLCAQPQPWLLRIRAHAMLPQDATIDAAFTQRIAPPDYYTPDISPHDTARIQEQTQEIHTALSGYIRQV